MTTTTVLPQQPQEGRRPSGRHIAVPAQRGPASTGSRPAAPTGLAARGRGTRRGDAALTLAGIGLGAAVGLGVDAARSGLHAPGGWLLAAGTVAALAGTYLCLALILLVSRVPWLEREVGHDRMVALHRRVAPYSLVLVLGHVVLTTMGYAAGARTGAWAEAWHLVTQTRWMLPAATSGALMAALGVMSARVVRSRMSYETWWAAHLYFYVAVALSFGHQVVLGPMFVGHRAATALWSGLFLGVAAVVVVSRVLAPLRLSRRHRLRVQAVVPEAQGFVSVYVTGVDLDLLQARGGQFFQWRFLTRHRWWQAHPYSLSASPNHDWLRITVKALGDHSRQLHLLRPGTRVLAEGPYGVFTAAARHGERVVAVAAGVGITPVLAVLEDLPHDADVTVLHRVPDDRSSVLAPELQQLAAERGWVVHRLVGPRSQHPMTPAYLSALAPGVSGADVYVCGPGAFTSAVVSAAKQLGVPDRRLHHEAFSF